MRSIEPGRRACGREPGRARQESNLPPLPPDAMIIVPVRNFVLFPGMVMPVTVGRAEVDRRRPAGRARAAPGRHPEAARPRGRRPDRDRHAPHGHGRQCRALHHRPGRRAIISSARASSASRCSNSSAAGRSWWRRCCASRNRPSRTPEIEARFLHLRGQALGSRSSCCRRRRANCRPRSRASTSPARWPTSPPPTWT